MNSICGNPLVALAQHNRLETERLVLRPLTLNDLEDYHAYTSDDDLLKYDYPAHQSKEESLEFLVLYNLAAPLGRYGIEIKSEQKLIGNISLRLSPEGTSVSLGYTLHPAYHGQGYATEAALALKNLAWELAQVKEIKAGCDQRNIASRRVLEKIGLNLVAVQENTKNMRGEIVTMLNYALFKPEIYE